MRNRPLRIIDLTDEPQYADVVERAVIIPYDLLDDTTNNRFEFKVKGLNCMFKVSKCRCCYESDTNHNELELLLTHDTQEERDTCWLLDSLWQTSADSIKQYQEYNQGAWIDVERK